MKWDFKHNDNEDTKALEYYQRVVEEYPGSPEAKNALLGIKNIYIDRNQADAYFEYTNKLGAFAVVGQAERDSLTYLSAEKLYMSGECDKSTIGFSKYLEEFPNGGSSSMPTSTLAIVLCAIAVTTGLSTTLKLLQVSLAVHQSKPCLVLLRYLLPSKSMMMR